MDPLLRVTLAAVPRSVPDIPPQHPGSLQPTFWRTTMNLRATTMNWTEDDKAWLVETLNTVVDTKLQAAEARILAGVDSKIEAVESKFSMKLEAVETKLLTEFHKWASPMEARQRTHTATLKAIDAEMEYLSDRVKKLEEAKA